MTNLFTPEDRTAVLKSASATPILADSQKHMAQSQRILAVFVAVSVALTLWVTTRITSLTEENQALAKDVRECTTPSKRGDEHKCYDRAQEDALRIRKIRDEQYTATQAAADQAAAAAQRSADAATAAKAASEFLSNCFKEEGPCTKSAERNQAFIRTQLATLLARITATEFKVTEVVGAKPGEPKFIATPVARGSEPVCSPLLTVIEKDIQVCMPAP
jgi:hypothetical protein